jgi:hypothetical protein
MDKHAKVYENSSSIGSFVWSSDSKKIAYVAEIKKSGKDKCFFTGDKKEGIDETNFEEVFLTLVSRLADFFSNDIIRCVV